MKSWIKKYRIETGIFFLAVIVRLLFFAIDYRAHGSDMSTMIGNGFNSSAEMVAHDREIGGDCYLETSDNLIHGRGFSCEVLPPFEPYQYGVPLYPIFLVALLWLTHSYAAIIVIQLLFSAFIPVVSMYLVRHIVSWPRAPVFVGAFLALEPSQTLVALGLSPEILFMLIFSAFIAVFLKYVKTPSIKLAALSGCILGFATLTKPTVQFLPIIVIVFLLWHFRKGIDRKLLGEIGVFLLFFIVVIAPWLYRNYSQFGALALSTQAPRALYVALLPSIISIDKGVSFDDAQAPLLRVHTNNFTFANAKGISSYVISQLISHPVATAKMFVLGGFTFMTHDGVLTLLQNFGVDSGRGLGTPAMSLAIKAPIVFVKTALRYVASILGLVLIARLILIVVFVLFLVGLYYLYRRHLNSPALDFAVILVLYFMLTTLFNGLAVTYRFRVPIEWVILAVAYSGCVFVKEKWARKNPR